ncbi:MAG: SUKH-3 domain-containing protein [Planctomyces sp.]|nr:SUKH-3 domain-containing protein [Planctomyces sp.]
MTDGGSIRKKWETRSIAARELHMIMPSPKVIGKFVMAGWSPTRRVEVPSFIPSEHPAAQVHCQFGGLTVWKCEAGIECATSDVVFRASPMDNGDDEVAVWQTLLDTTLVSIGDVHHGHGELFMSTDWRCFGRSNLHEAFCFEGNDFVTAIQNILLGIRSRPMLRPDQQVVTMYGIDYTATSPETYCYSVRQGDNSLNGSR